MEKRMPQLPEELIIQIFLWLPVKSLVRFMCVCKSWFSLISDPYFATLHFELAAALTQRIVFITSGFPQARSIDFEASLNDDAAIVSLKFDPLFSQSFLNIRIGGSCRGILFLHCNEGLSNESLYLWNPSTGMHKQIPWSPSMSSDVDSCIYIQLYGFGYDPSTDDYLVTLGSSTTINDDLTHFEFFSFRGNTWKEMEATDFPHAKVLGVAFAGTLINGAIHWMVFFGRELIVSFDLKKRNISWTPLPVEFNDYYPRQSALWICGGLLSLWAVDGDFVDIWVMKECEGHSSWTKTFVMAMPYCRMLFPICSTSCGDIVGYDSTGLEKYDGRGELLERRFYCKTKYISHDPVVLYTESLLPLPFFGDILHT